MSERTKGGLEPKNSASIGGFGQGVVMIVGKDNVALAEIGIHTVAPPASGTVEVQAALTEFRKVLSEIKSDDLKKIENAVDDAEGELRKRDPKRDEIGKALERALQYAEKAENFSSIVEKLKPHVLSVVSWLGTNWQFLLTTVGLTP